MNFKSIVLIPCLLLFALASFSQEKSGIKFSEGQWIQLVNKARQEKKYIFLDAYTSWCGPCKMLQRQVFPNKALGEFFNNAFINVAKDMEEGEGINLANVYRVQAYPTLFFIDPNTMKVVKQVIGYQEVDNLLNTAKNVEKKHKR